MVELSFNHAFLLLGTLVIGIEVDASKHEGGGTDGSPEEVDPDEVEDHEQCPESSSTPLAHPEYG